MPFSDISGSSARYFSTVICQHIVPASHDMTIHFFLCSRSVSLTNRLHDALMLLDRHLCIIRFRNHAAHRQPVPQFSNHIFHTAVTRRTPDLTVEFTVLIRVRREVVVLNELCGTLVGLLNPGNIHHRRTAHLCRSTL